MRFLPPSSASSAATLGSQIPPGTLISPSTTPRLRSLSPSLGLTPPPRSRPLIQPQLFPGRGSVGGGVSPNKPKALE